MRQSHVDRKTEVRDHFDAYAVNNRWGELYDPSNPLSHGFLARRAKTVVLLGPLQGKLLDVGCGTGSLLEILDSKVDYVGVDNAPTMIEQAARHINDLGLSARARVQQADVQALPFESNSFDAVVGLGLIEYFDDPRKVVAEAFRVAKPGARLVFNVPLRYSIDRVLVMLSTPIRAIARKLTGKAPDITHGLWTPRAFQEVFKSEGARVIGGAFYDKRLMIYPFSRFFPAAASKAASLVENRDAFDAFASGYLLACAKRT